MHSMWQLENQKGKNNMSETRSKFHHYQPVRWALQCTPSPSHKHYCVLQINDMSTFVFYQSVTWALPCFTNQLHEHYRVLPISQMHTTVLCCSTLQSCECYSVQLVIVLYQSDQWTLHCTVTWTLQYTTSQSQEQSNILSISQMSTAMMSSQPAKKHSNVLPDKH